MLTLNSPLKTVNVNVAEIPANFVQPCGASPSGASPGSAALTPPPPPLFFPGARLAVVARRLQRLVATQIWNGVMRCNPFRMVRSAALRSQRAVWLV